MKNQTSNIQQLVTVSHLKSALQEFVLKHNVDDSVCTMSGRSFQKEPAMYKIEHFPLVVFTFSTYTNTLYIQI